MIRCLTHTVVLFSGTVVSVAALSCGAGLDSRPAQGVFVSGFGQKRALNT